MLKIRESRKKEAYELMKMLEILDFE